MSKPKESHPPCHSSSSRASLSLGFQDTSWRAFLFVKPAALSSKTDGMDHVGNTLEDAAVVLYVPVQSSLAPCLGEDPWLSPPPPPPGQTPPPFAMLMPGAGPEPPPLDRVMAISGARPARARPKVSEPNTTFSAQNKKQSKTSGL